MGTAPHRRTAGGIIAWGAATALAAVLGGTRFSAAVAEGQPDLESFFLPAARAVMAGEGPYAVGGYFYTPLVALLLAPAAEHDGATAYWTALRLVAGIAACVLGAIAVTPRGRWIQSGVIASGAIVTLLWSWPTTLDLWLGQVELLVLLAVCIAAFATSRGAPVTAGAALGAAALVKTWPAAFLVWLLRADPRTRAREWIGVAVTAAGAVVLALGVAGVPGLWSMITAPFDGSSQPQLAANSAWGLPRLLFSSTSIGEPLLVSPWLRITTTFALVVVLMVLLAIVLVHPGPALISLFNVCFVVILLLPVSHYVYVIYALPTLWWWAAQLWRTPRSPVAWIAVGTLTTWWVLVFRISPAGDGFATTTWPSSLMIFGTSLLAAAVSIAGAWSFDRDQPRPPPLPSPSAQVGTGDR